MDVATPVLVKKPGIVLVGHIVDRIIEVEVVVVHPVHRVAHGALNHRVWRVGVHDVEDRVNYFIALDPQERRSKDLFRFRIHQNFHVPPAARTR